MQVEISGEITRLEIDGSSEKVVVLAHGAGANMDGKLLLKLRDTLVEHGFRVARFNFLYKEQGKSLPDRMPKLMETYTAIVEKVRSEVKPAQLICGGHSMGGRTASMLAAEGFAMDGLLMFAYPLHPAGKPEKLRDEHLPKIAVPALCINGTNDELCRRDLMEAVLPRLQASWRMHWIEQADHSLHVPKSSGSSDKEVLANIGKLVADWVGSSAD
ncbi:MAG TPA: alpha/beta fold hydrolase [Fimbriimonas sp.]|nr:alpha/beta fold hydrolase [Fimbriimonas sp.]